MAAPGRIREVNEKARARGPGLVRRTRVEDYFEAADAGAGAAIGAAAAGDAAGAGAATAGAAAGAL